MDAFGQQLWDAFHEAYAYQIIERDDRLIDASPIDVYFQQYDASSRFARDIVPLIRGRVLDVGCGAGRHALYLQSLGFDVLGIDISPLAIELSRKRGLKHGRVLGAHDVGVLPPASVDTVLMLGNNLALLGSRSRGRALLRKLTRVTTDSARIIGEELDPYQTTDDRHLAYHRANRRRGRMGGQIRMRARHRELIGPWFDYLFMSHDELGDLIVGTGWRIERLLGDGAYYTAVLART